MEINTELKEHGAMTDAIHIPSKQWTRKQAILLSIVCLVCGIAGGWSIPGSHSEAAGGPVQAVSVPGTAGMGAGAASQAPSPARLKEMADAQAAPLGDQLRSDPNNPNLLVSIGNVYYDAQQYPTAVDYYSRFLKAKPSDAAVRTDRATAYWYMGNADLAIAEFNKALTYSPNNPNTLFNLGVVKWKGKMDTAGALADWEKLLSVAPNYEGRSKVEQMIAEVKKQ
jgi:cytochrome c-type biogenesis protein CcmH/NrfG